MPSQTSNVPSWLFAAEVAFQQAQGSKLILHRSRAMDQAHRINKLLQSLGIEPERLAECTSDGKLTPALLISPDPEGGYHGVHAGFREDPDGGEVVLLVQDYEDSKDIRHWGILHGIGDVAVARRELPVLRAPKPNYRRSAEQSMDSLHVDHMDPSAAAVAGAINGLTAAVLYLAEVTARSNSRP